jgi:TRAP-type C4-dicarboxylate transport system substrate-binding protein
VHTFLSSLADYIPGVKMDKTFKVFSAIRTLLKTNSCVRLYGLLIHYVYWNILHPAARKAVEEVLLEILNNAN